MYPSNAQGNPTPLASLDDLMEEGGTADKPMKVFIGHNLGFRTFMMYVPMHEFFEMSEVANDPTRDGEAISQRKLDPAHAQKLALYILKGLVTAAIARRSIENKAVPAGFLEVQGNLGKQPYLSVQPLVVNIRECNSGGENLRGVRMMTAEHETAAFKIFLSQKHVLWVVDGQHRRKGMEMVFQFLDELRTKRVYPKKGSLYQSPIQEISSEEMSLWEECFIVARTFCTVGVEVHLGLDIDQERQLFHDLNRLSKKVETSIALSFDNSNPVNLFIKERIITNLGVKVQERDQADWHADDGAVSRKDLVAINAILFLNKTNIASATPPDVTPKAEIAYRFWEAVTAIPGFGEPQAREKTVAAQPVVLKALAKLVYDFAFSNRRPDNSEAVLNQLLDGITEIDFSHQNWMWQYFDLSEAERATHHISDLARYLPEDDASVNRDIGKFQGDFMRFGAKHNDIYPIIGDMIRWKLELPNRHKKAIVLEDL
ncbi:DNA sulfur modification protein DndB [Undibacterium sp.]|uniref:DNA sulfur modification protein DndB n=1 Tax=Undibacterium sp. TaxID=1914977 RepID=UPI00272F6FF9|nr:DNA sulfur modification protein DndB [Undibacterium sp.]MDP1978708.1 DNA sulfur modification protein DndB [Undibacterium sp.]